VVTMISLGVDFAAAACAREVCLTAAGFTAGLEDKTFWTSMWARM
jgi:hypothetical protein